MLTKELVDKFLKHMYKMEVEELKREKEVYKIAFGIDQTGESR